jgi:hypothetical protein
MTMTVAAADAHYDEGQRQQYQQQHNQVAILICSANMATPNQPVNRLMLGFPTMANVVFASVAVTKIFRCVITSTFSKARLHNIPHLSINLANIVTRNISHA